MGSEAVKSPHLGGIYLYDYLSIKSSLILPTLCIGAHRVVVQNSDTN